MYSSLARLGNNFPKKQINLLTQPIRLATSVAKSSTIPVKNDEKSKNFSFIFDFILNFFAETIEVIKFYFIHFIRISCLKLKPESKSMGT